MASRRIEDLAPDTREKAHEFARECMIQGLDVIIYCTHRSDDEQARLYRRGRSLAEIKAMAAILENHYGRPDLAEILMGVGPQYGRRVTNAAPGQSAHPYRVAFDGVPIRCGKPIWTDEGIPNEEEEDQRLWQLYGQIAESVGLEWAGRWPRFREMPHIQEPGFNWEEMIRNSLTKGI